MGKTERGGEAPSEQDKSACTRIAEMDGSPVPCVKMDETAEDRRKTRKTRKTLEGSQALPGAAAGKSASCFFGDARGAG